MQPFKKGGDVQGERHCRKCDYSWILPPTSKEIQAGAITARMYCCAPKVQQKLNGETFPRLVEIAREDETLCGSRGKHWIPIKEVFLKTDDTVAKVVQQIPSKKNGGVGHPYRSARSAAGKAQVQDRPTRKPYKVA